MIPFKDCRSIYFIDFSVYNLASMPINLVRILNYVLPSMIVLHLNQLYEYVRLDDYSPL